MSTPNPLTPPPLMALVSEMEKYAGSPIPLGGDELALQSCREITRQWADQTRAALQAWAEQPIQDEDLKRAIFFANKALDVPWSDPDDDLRTVSRQFLRALERLERMLGVEEK